jgi:hypothetical protein
LVAGPFKFLSLVVSCWPTVVSEERAMKQEHEDDPESDSEDITAPEPSGSEEKQADPAAVGA